MVGATGIEPVTTYHVNEAAVAVRPMARGRRPGRICKFNVPAAESTADWKTRSERRQDCGCLSLDGG